MIRNKYKKIRIGILLGVISLNISAWSSEREKKLSELADFMGMSASVESSEPRTASYAPTYSVPSAPIAVTELADRLLGSRLSVEKRILGNKINISLTIPGHGYQKYFYFSDRLSFEEISRNCPADVGDYLVKNYLGREIGLQANSFASLMIVSYDKKTGFVSFKEKTKRSGSF